MDLPLEPIATTWPPGGTWRGVVPAVATKERWRNQVADGEGQCEGRVASRCILGFGWLMVRNIYMAFVWWYPL